ncbi:MSP domain-containing protein [Mycena indigotica]|uniref:MSP domain-containing protein n=1 Tax=Mycena indigotica TaxID=2126181 RepID=A0A8H6VYZ9_9AGAR|nr:MSP domain-containing protein [Mycena indigotica]KAF7298982.1 MSP domain-containing protein [Mycena indigotica]
MSVSLTPNHALGFHRPLTTLVKRSLTISNHNSQPVAFKVKTTAPKLYCVRPNTGRVEPGQSVDVSVMLQPLKDEPPTGAKCKDKFLIQSTLISPDKEAMSVQDIWSGSDINEEGKVHQQKLRVTYLPPEGQTLVEEDEEPHANLSSSMTAADSQLHDPSRQESAYATVRQRLPVNGDTTQDSVIAARPSTPPGDFSVAQEELHEEPPFKAPGVVITPPEPEVIIPVRVSQPAVQPAPVSTPIPPAPVRTPSVPTPAAKPSPSPPSEDYASKYIEAQAEIERLRGLLTTSQPPAELRRRTRKLSDATAVDVAVLEEAPIQEGVPLQVVVIIALGVFITTYLFF